MAESSTENIPHIRTRLIELGLFEAGMTSKEMLEILAVVDDSYVTANEEKRSRDSNEKASKETGLERNYLNVLDRRMPWSLFPTPEQLSLEQKARVLAAYKEQQSICGYRKAKNSLTFTNWEYSVRIPVSIKSVVESDYKTSIRQSRSGRLLKTTPNYEDDGSDSDISYAKKRSKKKAKRLSNEEIILRSSLFRDPIAENSMVSNADKKITDILMDRIQPKNLMEENIESPQIEQNERFFFKSSIFTPKVAIEKCPTDSSNKQVSKNTSTIVAIEECDLINERMDESSISTRNRSKRMKVSTDNEV